MVVTSRDAVVRHLHRRLNVLDKTLLLLIRKESGDVFVLGQRVSVLRKINDNAVVQWSELCAVVGVIRGHVFYLLLSNEARRPHSPQPRHCEPETFKSDFAINKDDLSSVLKAGGT